MVLAWDDRDITTPSNTSVGELLPNCEGRIVDEYGTEVARGQRGEFWCRGPNVMKGYWRNKKATEETLTTDRWLKTGDVAYIDEHDKLFIVDRKKVCRIPRLGAFDSAYRRKHGTWWLMILLHQELIKVRGSQVAPAELEALLLEHPLIVDAAVIGVKV